MKPLVPLVILVRLFSLYWGAVGLLGLLVAFSQFIGVDRFSSATLLSIVLTFLGPVLYGVIAFLAWVFALKIGRLLVAGVDPDWHLPEARPETLYTLGLLLLGCYFLLDHLAPLLNGLHYLVLTRDEADQSDDGQAQRVYQVSRHLIPCAGGLVVAMLSQKFARKLVRSGPAIVGSET